MLSSCRRPGGGYHCHAVAQAPLDGWSVIGSFDPANGLLAGYPGLPKQYVEDACKRGYIHTLFVPEVNRTFLLSELEATEVSNPENPKEMEKTCRLMVSLGKDDEEEEAKGGEEAKEKQDGGGGHEEAKVNEQRAEVEKVERVVKVVFCRNMVHVITYIHEHGPPEWRS